MDFFSRFKRRLHTHTHTPCTRTRSSIVRAVNGRRLGYRAEKATHLFADRKAASSWPSPQHSGRLIPPVDSRFRSRLALLSVRRSPTLLSLVHSLPFRRSRALPGLGSLSPPSRARRRETRRDRRTPRSTGHRRFGLDATKKSEPARLLHTRSAPDETLHLLLFFLLLFFFDRSTRPDWRREARRHALDLSPARRATPVPSPMGCRPREAGQSRGRDTRRDNAERANYPTRVARPG